MPDDPNNQAVPMLRGEFFINLRGKQCYPVGLPNQKRPKEQTQHPVRNKTLFLRKVSMSTSSDNMCDKNYGFARCGYMGKRYIEHYIICCPNQGCWCSIDSMPRKLNCFNASTSLSWVNTSNVMKYVLE